MQLFYKTETTSRISLFQWSSLFSLFNLIIVLIIATSYISTMPTPENTLSWTYFISMSLGHFSFLITLIFLFFIAPVLLLIPKKSVVITLFIILATLGITLLKIDTYVFDQYKFHINLFLVQMIIDAGDQIIGFPARMWITLFVAVSLLITLEIVTARILWNRHEVLYKKIRPHWILTAFFILNFVSHFIHMYADAQYDRSVTSLSRYYPLLIPATAKNFMIKHGWGNIKQAEASTTIKTSSNLNYPLAQLTFDAPSANEKPMNLLIITIDSWRFDMMDKDVTPNIYSMAEQSIRYENHYSGSNDTRNGIFSMFYSLPGTYWSSFESNQLGPVLIDRLLDLNYQTGIFASAPLINPEFDRTVFKRITDLQTSTEGKTAHLRDIKITEQWQQWLAQHQEQSADKPFFGFLFYDAIHAYDYPSDYPRHFQPTLPYMNYFNLNNDTDVIPVRNLYKNITNFVDSLVGKVLDDLSARGLLENTVVIITGDHAQELNDNKLNYWGHNSDYTRYQTHVPMIIHWPGKAAATVTQMTTHFDLAPTLMNNLLFSQSDAGLYSIGRDLFADKLTALDSHIMGNYFSFAILDIENELMLVKDFNGAASTYDLNYREVTDKKVKPELVRKAVDEMARFYK